MSASPEELIKAAVNAVVDPYNGVPLADAKAVKAVSLATDKVSVDIVLGYPSGHLARSVVSAVVAAVRQLSDCQSVDVRLTHKIIAHAVQQGVDALPGVRNIIAVASGKGGVGKSTTAVNLALALAYEGARVGVLDADIYGPSQPQMLGTDARPQLAKGEEQRIQPIQAHGLQAMSIGFLIDKETPMIWRGPMATQALDQLFRETAWDDLDYLIVDLPPGTGDIQLTLAQRIPVSGAIIVTTPQDIALLDAIKALKMFEKVKVSIVGVVENMSTHICSHCGHEEHVFGTGGGQRMASDHGVPLLGSVPLDIRVREQADGGRPTVAIEPDGSIGIAYREIALKAAARLALQGKDFARKFPKITVVND